jgi:hypothetical protein
VVQDYKWSKGSGYRKFADDRVLQLPLYAAALVESTGVPVAAAVYRTLRDGEAPGYWRSDLVDGEGLRPSDRVDEETARATLEHALATARRAADGIRSGRIEAEPAMKDACTYCAAASLCRRRV